MTWHQNSISPPKSSPGHMDEKAEYNVDDSRRHKLLQNNMSREFLKLNVKWIKAAKGPHDDGVTLIGSMPTIK